MTLMLAAIADALILGFAAAAVLDLVVGLASGSLALLCADRDRQPETFRLYALAEFAGLMCAAAWLAKKTFAD